MKRVYVSLPMKGRTDEKIKEVRKDARRKALEYYNFDENIDVLDSFYRQPLVDRQLEFLIGSLELLNTADIVYFAEGWSESIGCIIEYLCAKIYGITMIDASNSNDLLIMNHPLSALLKKR